MTFVIHLFAALGGQAMQKDGFGSGLLEQRRVHLIGSEVGAAAFPFRASCPMLAHTSV